MSEPEDKPPDVVVAERAFELGSLINPRPGEDYAIFVFKEGSVGFMTSLSTMRLSKELKRFAGQISRQKAELATVPGFFSKGKPS